MMYVECTAIFGSVMVLAAVLAGCLIALPYCFDGGFPLIGAIGFCAIWRNSSFPIGSFSAAFAFKMVYAVSEIGLATIGQSSGAGIIAQFLAAFWCKIAGLADRMNMVASCAAFASFNAKVF